MEILIKQDTKEALHNVDNKHKSWICPSIKGQSTIDQAELETTNLHNLHD